MPAIGWPRPSLLELGWAVLVAVCLMLMILSPPWETIPFHVIWISLTLFYGFRVWRDVDHGGCARCDRDRLRALRSFATRSTANSRGASCSRYKNVVCPPANFDFTFFGVCLAGFIKCHHDNGCAKTLANKSFAEKFFFSFFHRN